MAKKNGQQNEKKSLRKAQEMQFGAEFRAADRAARNPKNL
ncbi:YfhE family protein [Alkalihalobacillus pseudalcaliphilus]|nr:YfhE family protein [Alkalihalobacillus pseudalcaliphilus]